MRRRSLRWGEMYWGLAIALASILGTVAPRAWADGIPGVVFGNDTGTSPPTNPVSTGTPAAPTAEPVSVDVTSIAYTQAMLVGYEAAEQRDYQTALINFRRALEVRPGDYYALAAIANMEDYIAQQRREVARRQRIDQLQVTLGEAVQARDWACTAATVDELITLVPSNSLERTRLVTYRSEVTVFLDSRSDVEQWSTICPG